MGRQSPNRPPSNFCPDHGHEWRFRGVVGGSDGNEEGEVEEFTGEWDKIRREEKPGGQLDWQDAAFHAPRSPFHLPLLPEEMRR